MTTFDAVRAAVGVLIHPVQGAVKLGRVVEPDAAEHPQAAGPADRGGDVLGWGETDDGMLDTQPVAQSRPQRAHGFTPTAGWSAAYWRAQP